MKKSIHIITGIVAFTVMAAFTTISESDGFYRIDTGASTIEWSGSKITGKTHKGTVGLIEGGLQLTSGMVSNGKFAIDMTTIACTDIEDEGMRKKLTKHLKNEDFFAVEKFGTAHVSITGMNDDGQVNADLTVKGITHPVSFPVTISVENKEITATATIEMDRSKFDVRYGSDTFFDNLGDKAIDNIIRFSVTLKGRTN